MIRLLKLLLIAILLGLLALPGAGLRAERKRGEADLAPAPPPPVAQTLTVRPGEALPIPLGIHGARGEQLAFLIRSQPKLGKLSPVKSTGQNTAVVSYTAGAESGEDRFTYAVRTSDGVSAPALVSITVAVAPALPARLVADEQLNFSPVVAGQKTSALLTVTNQGGEAAIGDVTVSEPWSLDGGRHYEIPGGRSAEFRLVFAPAKPGEFQGSATLGPHPQRAVALQGTATSPLEVTPTTVEMSAPSGNSTRSGKFRIQNHTAQPQEIKITAHERLLVDGKVTIPSSDSKEIPVFASADNPSAIDEKVHLESGSWTSDLTVHGDPFPAKLKFTGTSLDFGKITPGETAEAIVTVENSGGVPALAAARVDPPFELDTAGLNVPATGSAKILVHWPYPKAGSYSANLIVRAGSQEETFPFTVTVAPSPESSAPHPPASVNATPPESTGTPPPADPSPGETTTGGTIKKPLPIKAAHPELLKPISLAEAPAQVGKYTRATTTHSAVLEWPVTMKPGPPFSLLERHLQMKPDGSAIITWSPLDAVHFTDEGGKHVAEVKGLEADRLYIVRVAGNGVPVLTAQFVTPAPQPLISMQTSMISGLILVFAVVAWWQIRSRVKSGW